MENSKEVDDLLEQYFTIDELKNISSYEKLSYFNIWKNYEMLVSLGLNPPLPKFLQQKVNCEKETAATSDDSEGLVQDFHSKVAEGKESKKRKAAKEAADPSAESSNTRLGRRARVCKKSREDSPQKEKFAVQKQLENSKNGKGKVDDRYPKRNVLKKDYKDGDFLSDDEFLYCKDCGREYKGPCRDHGPMTLIAETKVPKDSSVPQQALSVSIIRKAPHLFPDVYYYTCDRCGQRFTDPDALHRHKKCHLRAKRRRRCPDSTDHAGNLQHHLLTHIGERPHACNLCPKTFAQKGHLQRHSLVHSGEKLHTCPICHSAFAQAENLHEHERSVHSDARPYTCSVCGKSFDDDGARMRHELMHSGQQPHHCPQCDRSFSKSQHLKQHEARLHPLVFLYSCQFCEIGFWTVGELRAHVQKNHFLEV